MLKKLSALLLLTAALAASRLEVPTSGVIGAWGPVTQSPTKPLFNQFADSPTIWTALESFTELTRALNFSESHKWNGPEDGIYIAPTQEDLDDLFAFIRHRRENLGYIPEANDCDDLATEAKYWATVWSVRRYSRTQGGLLFGKAYVRLDGDYTLLFPKLKNNPVFGYHVLIFYVRSDGRIFFFEPQTDCVAPIESFIYEGSIEVLKIEY